VTFKGAAMFIAISKAIEFGIGAAGKKSLYFDEIALPKELGCFSNGQLGFNACRLHLQEIGVSCYAFDYLTHAELLRMSGSRILMQRKHGPVAQGDAAMYRQFVQMGGSMILLVDRHDLHLKQDLLAAFGISASIIEFPENTERSLTASVRMGAQEAAPTREFAVPLIDPVALHADAGSEILATANLPQPGDDGTNICNVIVATTAGRGTLLVVGALSPWQNVRFDGDLHQDCLDALIEYLDGLSPVGTGDRLAISRPTSSPAPVEAGAPAQASPLAS
jgi:hypothetical protein